MFEGNIHGIDDFIIVSLNDLGRQRVVAQNRVCDLPNGKAMVCRQMDKNLGERSVD